MSSLLNQKALADLLDEDGAPRPGAPLGALLSAQALRRPDAPAFTFGEQRLSFAQLDQASNRMARALALRGAGQGDVVIVSMPNRPDYVVAVYALWKLGATPCPISHRLTAGEFSEIVDLARPRFIIGTGATPVARSRLFDVEAQVTAGLDEGPLPPVLSSPGKILGSGGSTGRPKLIVDPRSSGWGPDKASSYRPPFSTILNAGPLYHTAPFAYAIVALAEGSHVICMERFDAAEWLRLAEKHRVTAATLVPTMMSRIARYEAGIAERADLSSFHYLMHTSAMCPEDVKRWWIARVGPEVIWEVYGGTERLGFTLINGIEWLQHPRSVGRPPPGDAVVIVDSQGRPLPAGEVGEIFFRRSTGVGTSYRYIGSETRVRTDIDGMGDMGWLDADGYLYIADRRTDMIVVGGVNVFPAEIEAALERVPGVLCAAVIGLPDADMGNRIHAIVELAQDTDVPDPAVALEYLAPALSQLAPNKHPRSVEFTHQRVRDDAGKVRRSALRDARM